MMMNLLLLSSKWISTIFTLKTHTHEHIKITHSKKSRNSDCYNKIIYVISAASFEVVSVFIISKFFFFFSIKINNDDYDDDDDDGNGDI